MFESNRCLEVERGCVTSTSCCAFCKAACCLTWFMRACFCTSAVPPLNESIMCWLNFVFSFFSFGVVKRCRQENKNEMEKKLGKLASLNDDSQMNVSFSPNHTLIVFPFLTLSPSLLLFLLLPPSHAKAWKATLLFLIGHVHSTTESSLMPGSYNMGCHRGWWEWH